MAMYFLANEELQFIYSVANESIKLQNLGLTKLKAFADDKLSAYNIEFVCYLIKTIAGKVENDGY